MPSPPSVDFEVLLAPVTGDSPAGRSLRYAGDYDAIKEARRAEDNLNQGEWKREVKVPNWREVTRLATSALAGQSKDIQIGAWLTEALASQSGFGGARDGLRLLRELHERFWDSLYPAVDDGDLEARAAVLEWLNDKLPECLRKVSLTKPAAGGVPYSWVDWDQSRAVDELGRKNPQAMAAAIAEGKIKGEQFDKAVGTTPRAFYEPLCEDLSQCREECQKLEAAVDQKFGHNGPSLNAIKTALDDCRTLLEPILKRKRELEPDPVPVKPTAGAQAQILPNGPQVGRTDGVQQQTVPDLAQAGITLEPRDRADALRRLEAVAEFFRRTEPHSPVSYLIQRAVRWGEMPLEQWLKDVIADQATLARVREILGLNQPAAAPAPAQQTQQPQQTKN